MDNHTILPEQLKRQLESARESDKKMAEFSRLMQFSTTPIATNLDLLPLQFPWLMKQQKPAWDYNK